jgi:uncharacterized protein YraI
MRNLFSFLLLFVLLILVSNALAQDTPTFTVNVGEQSIEHRSHALNVRSGASREYTVRGVVADGDVLTVTGRTAFDTNRTCDGYYNANTDMWLRVDFQGIEGWVGYCLGQFQGDLNSVPVTEPIYPVLRRQARYGYIHSFPSGLDELGSAPLMPYIRGNVRYSRINLRRNPVLDGEIIDILTSESVYVIGCSANRQWLKVTYLGISPFNRVWWRGAEPQTGWIAANTLFTLPQGWEDIIPITE